MNIQLKKINSYRRFALFVGIFAALTACAGIANHALAQGSGVIGETEGRVISIYDRGTERVIVTKARTLRQALELADVDVAISHDIVEPKLDTELVATKYNVNIYRARPVTVVDGSLRQRVTTAEQTPEGIAEAVGMKLYKEDQVSIGATNDLLLDGAGVVMTIERATPVNLTVYGTKTEVRTQAKTVGELLQDKEIVVSAEDTLSVALSAPIISGMSIELWRDGKQTVTVEEDVEFQIEKINDANREIGYREVKTAGENGKRSVTYEIEMKNGQEVGRTEITSITIKESVTQVEVVGVKNNYSDSLNEWLYALRMCETHGNYQTNTGNGYYGAYQFLPSTWNSIAKRVGRTDLIGIMPHQAAPADQDAMVIANANATAGLSTQHPGCYKKLGLSNKPPAQ